MLNSLPEWVQQEIMTYLETHNFIAAKELYDKHKPRAAQATSELGYARDLCSVESS